MKKLVNLSIIAALVLTSVGIAAGQHKKPVVKPALARPRTKAKLNLHRGGDPTPAFKFGMAARKGVTKSAKRSHKAAVKSVKSDAHNTRG